MRRVKEVALKLNELSKLQLAQQLLYDNSEFNKMQTAVYCRPLTVHRTKIYK